MFNKIIEVIYICLILIYPYYTIAEQETEVDSTSINTSEGWELSLGVGYPVLGLSSSSDYAHFGSDNFSSIAGRAILEFEKGVSVNFESRILKEDSFGFIIGVQLDETLVLNNVKLEGPISVASLDNLNISLKSYGLYLAPAYRWKKMYIPFGLKINWIEPINNKLSDRQFDTAVGKIGLDVGVGWIFNDRIAMELKYSKTTFSLQQRFENSTVGEFSANDIELSRLIVVLRMFL